MIRVNIYNAITLFVMVGSLFISTVWGIKCFQCNSYAHPECAGLEVNDTNSSFFKECDAPPSGVSFCRKHKQRLLDKEVSNVSERIVRSCGYVTYKSNDTANCVKRNSEIAKEVFCQCFTDACNGANHLGYSFIHFLIMPSIVYLLL